MKQTNQEGAITDYKKDKSIHTMTTESDRRQSVNFATKEYNNNIQGDT